MKEVYPVDSRDVKETTLTDFDDTGSKNTSTMPSNLPVLYERSKSRPKTGPSKSTMQFFLMYLLGMNFTWLIFTIVEHWIDVGGSKPIKYSMRRVPLGFVNGEEAHLRTMLDKGLIQPSCTVLISKRDGSFRWYSDYRALNTVIIKEAYLFTLVGECMDVWIV